MEFIHIERAINVIKSVAIYADKIMTVLSREISAFDFRAFEITLFVVTRFFIMQE